MGNLLDDFYRIEKRRETCPICERKKYCLKSYDGTKAICTKEASDKPRGDAGWLHVLHEDMPPPKKKKRKKKKPKPPPKKPPQNWAEMLESMKQHTKERHLGQMSDDFNLPQESLKDSEAVIAEYKGSKVYAFPMKDEMRREVGFRLENGNAKFCWEGSNNAHFFGTDPMPEGPVLLPEGPKDRAAAHALGFESVGRPNDRACKEELKDIIRRYYRNRDIVIVADNDDAGKRGAKEVAGVIWPITKSLKIISAPAGKDMRDWFHAGATHGAVLAVIKNAREYKGKGKKEPPGKPRRELKRARCSRCKFWQQGYCQRGVRITEPGALHWCADYDPRASQ